MQPETGCVWLSQPLPVIDASKQPDSAGSANSVSTAAIALLAILLTILMTRRLIKPLRELNDAAKITAEGDLSALPSHQTKDEVEMLADSFQQTVSHLQNISTISTDWPTVTD